MQADEVIGRIQALCQARSWTLYRLAKESGITYSTLCTLVHKANMPSLPTLAKICEGFGITLFQFFDIGNDYATLTEPQKSHLELWNRLSPENQQTAKSYMEYLLSQQNP